MELTLQSKKKDVIIHSNATMLAMATDPKWKYHNLKK